MSKITVREILDMNQRQIKAYLDLYPEDGFKISLVLLGLSIKIRFTSIIRMIRNRY
jgi:hypothetical protein